MVSILLSYVSPERMTTRSRIAAVQRRGKRKTELAISGDKRKTVQDLVLLEQHCQSLPVDNCPGPVQTLCLKTPIMIG